MTSLAEIEHHPTTLDEFIKDQPRVDAVMKEVYTRGDRMMSWLVGLHIGLSVIFAAIYQTWVLSAIVAAAGGGMFFLSVKLLPRQRLTRIIAGISLQTFVALHIYQLHGLPEMHFFFFTAFTAMVVYEDGKAMWPGTILIILQHILFAGLQNSGVNLYFFEDPYIGIRKLFFHFGIAILHVVLCGAWAHFLRDQALRDAFQRERLLVTQEERERDMEARFAIENAKARAVAATKAKGDFLATMSHEMRTPLNGILGMGDLLSRGSLGPKQSEQLETLLICADNLLALVNDVLDLSKIEEGRLDIERRSFEVRLMSDDVLAVNAARAQSKGLELFAVVDQSVPESIVGDMTRTRQTLTNLVSNAVKFTNQGEVEVRVSLDEGSKAGAEEVRIRFSVRDTGIGIDEATRSRLFSPFTQADSSISRRFGGSGLGLAISKRLVEAMGGEIGFESVAREGSQFYFTLPFKTVAAEAAAVTFEGRKAVVVGCHAGTRGAIRELLAARKLDAFDAGEVPAQCPDIIVLDSDIGEAALARFGSGKDGARAVVVSRGGVPVPSWAKVTVPWPIRSAPLDAAILQVLDPTRAHERPVERGLAWKSAEERSVLLVEDNPVNQVVAQSILEDLGLRVEVAEDGECGLTALRERKFDLVLMDCQMPTLDGFEATRRFRSSEPKGSHTPIFALTAQVMAGDAEKCLAAGMDDYLSKPIERRALVGKLERLFGRGPRSLGGSTRESPTSGGDDVHDKVATADQKELEAFLMSFATTVGTKPRDKVKDAFVRTIPELVKQLSSPPTADVRAKTAHSLKGAARTVGLAGLAQRLAELEHAIPVDDKRARELSTEVANRFTSVLRVIAADDGKAIQEGV